MFSLVFVGIAVVGIVVWAYLVKTCDLRRRLREQSAQAPFVNPERPPGEK